MLLPGLRQFTLDEYKLLFDIDQGALLPPNIVELAGLEGSHSVFKGEFRWGKRPECLID